FLQRVLSLSSYVGKPTRLAGLVGVVLALLISLPSEKLKSEDHLNLEGRDLEGSWINHVTPILPPGVTPVTFQTHVTVSGGGGWIGSDQTKPFSSRSTAIGYLSNVTSISGLSSRTFSTKLELFRELSRHGRDCAWSERMSTPA